MRFLPAIMLLLLLLFPGCEGQPNVSGTEENAQTKQGTGARQAAPQWTRGQVAETMDAKGYTYMLVKAQGDQLWIASKLLEVGVGDTVEFGRGDMMYDFTSSTLDRTFDEILFVGSARAFRPDGTPRGVAGFSHSNAGGSDSAGTDVSPLARAEGGLTIEEIFAQRMELAGQQVKVRGRVVKSNSGILGKNWLHLQDGTGQADTRTHDLVITTQQTAQVGDTVLVVGTVAVDRDLGMGYKYSVLVEEAQVTVE